MHRSLAFFAPLALAACGQPREDAAPQTDDTPSTPASTPAPAPAPAPVPTVAAAAAPAAFMQCKVCHSIEPGKHGVGPSLAGISGTRAGDIPGFAFSSAMTASGLTWDEATLDRFLENPRQVVPGTKMVFPGIKDAAKRTEVIAYLKTL